MFTPTFDLWCQAEIVLVENHPSSLNTDVNRNNRVHRFAKNTIMQASGHLNVLNDDDVSEYDSSHRSNNNPVMRDKHYVTTPRTSVYNVCRNGGIVVRSVNGAQLLM